MSEPKADVEFSFVPALDLQSPVPEVDFDYPLPEDPSIEDRRFLIPPETRPGVRSHINPLTRKRETDQEKWDRIVKESLAWKSPDPYKQFKASRA